MAKYALFFNQIGINDVGKVGGKNASLGEMFSQLTPKGIRIPDGFATTSEAYWRYIDHNGFRQKLQTILNTLDTSGFSNLSEVGKACRTVMVSGSFPEEVQQTIHDCYESLVKQYGEEYSFAVRSSATAEDLPKASFAGQQETYLNVKGWDNILKACQRCYASLFTDRAIKYRFDNGFESMKVALSIGVQLMVRSDLASSGVMFTLDPDTGFENVVLVSAAWGLGENVVQGSVNTDDFLVFKPFLGKMTQPIISRKLGSKDKTMVYSEKAIHDILRPEEAIINLDTPTQKQEIYCINDADIITLAKWGTQIQQYYGRHMDIEWAKDGMSGELFIVQARPETVYSNQTGARYYTEYAITKKGKLITAGVGLGNRITTGKARILHSPTEIAKLQQGEILVTQRTDPDWDPILKKAAAIITDKGGRTSHAAIVAREVGAIAIVGTGNATQTIQDGQTISVSAVEGDTGYVYEGVAEWTENKMNLDNITLPHTKSMLILGHPDQAFKLSFLPNDGIGLMRMEFIINNAIQIHPMALRHFEKIESAETREKIEQLTHHFANKEDYFVHKLAESTAVIAAAFYPKDVIVRMSDFKSNEYANLIGGKQFEPKEENPMIGFRGASRYYHPLYQEGFDMECRAMKIVREEMGFTNVKLMIPFCRTLDEARKVIERMTINGLNRGENHLELYVMIEIPSNALLASEFAKLFDGFSIGSNDLTQLTLGADRDSELLSEIFTPFDPAVQELIRMTLQKAKAAGTKTGLCGQAPSDYPEYTQFLVELGINSISFNPDALVKGIENIHLAESKMQDLIPKAQISRDASRVAAIENINPFLTNNV